MSSLHRFALAGFASAALVLALAPARAAELEHACLNQKERRAEIELGRVVKLGSAIHAARARMPGTVIRATLCQGPVGLVYVLTVLAHDGKVARITVDAVKGTLVGGL